MSRPRGEFLKSLLRHAPAVLGVALLVASAATRLRRIEAADLVPSDLSAWRDLRDRAAAVVFAFDHGLVRPGRDC